MSVYKCACVYLVLGKVLLVAGVTAQDSQTVLTEQVFGVSMSFLKVRPHV